MAVTTVHAQLIRYTNEGTQVIVNLKSTGDDVSVSRSSNGNLPSSVSSVQGLANSLGALAFKNSIADATTSASGLMTASMVSKLNGIAAGANAYSHPNSGVSAGTYRSVTVNAQGHVTTGSNPTTLAGYGITDAANSSHTHYSLRTIADYRNDNTTPNAYNGVISFSGLKQTNKINSPSSDTYSYVVGLRGWTDSSGGVAHEFAFNNTGVFRRIGETTTWMDWLRILDSGNYTGYTVTKTGGGASGTWGINVTGSAGSVAWENVSGKPSSFTPSSHTHTKSQITDFPSSLPASDVYAWAKASSKPSYSWSEITDKPSTFTPASHTHNYAGSGSAGGSANSAVKLDTTTAGSATQPVYFTGGKPVACSYTLGKSVPSNAVFTDTNTWRGIQNNLTSDSTTDSLSAAQGKILNESKLMHKTIASAVDWDTLTETGIYHFRVSSTIADHHAAVEGYWGTLIVDFTVGTPYQIYIPDAISSHQYRRTYNGSAGKWNTNWVVQHFTDTTYGNATQSSSGLMSNSDKKKLDTTDFLKVQAATPTESCIWCKIDA